MASRAPFGGRIRLAEDREFSADSQPSAGGRPRRRAANPRPFAGGRPRIGRRKARICPSELPAARRSCPAELPAEAARGSALLLLQPVRHFLCYDSSRLSPLQLRISVTYSTDETDALQEAPCRPLQVNNNSVASPAATDPVHILKCAGIDPARSRNRIGSAMPRIAIPIRIDSN